MDSMHVTLELKTSQEERLGLNKNASVGFSEGHGQTLTKYFLNESATLGASQ
jgi:hypothetical protein